MKIRSGFVSNSSSSSFVMLGFKIKPEELFEMVQLKKDESFYEAVDKLGLDLVDIGDGKEVVVGKFLADVSSDEYLEEYEYTQQDLANMTKEVREKLKIKSTRASIFTGTRAT